MQESHLVKKSPIVIVRNFVAVQFLAATLYLVSTLWVYYAQIWRGLPLVREVPFEVARAVFIFATEMVVVLYIFLLWYRETVMVRHDQLVHDRGLLRRQHAVIPFSQVATVTFTQNLLGKLTHYGTILLHDAAGTVLMRLSDMSEPQQFVDELLERLRGSGPATVVPHELLDQEEHERLERKSTFRWDLKAGKVNRAIERSAMKTVAAFLNTDGGNILLGVGDDSSVVGLEYDYATLNRPGADGFENHFSNIFNAMLGAHVRHLVKTRAFSVQGKECMLISVTPSQQPVYLQDDGKEEFFVRTGNGTASLKLSEAAAYINSRWGTKK